MTLLGLCGSIRKESSNYALLKAVEALLPASTQWINFDIKTLPFFDPHLQFSEGIPALIKDLRSQAKTADYIVISTPEYAHGIPGILKNALEWLICEETMQKKVVILIASPSGGEFVKEYLTETLRTMDLLPSPELTFILRDGRTQITPSGEITNEELKASLQKFVDKFSAETIQGK